MFKRLVFRVNAIMVEVYIHEGKLSAEFLFSSSTNQTHLQETSLMVSKYKDCQNPHLSLEVICYSAAIQNVITLYLAKPYYSTRQEVSLAVYLCKKRTHFLASRVLLQKVRSKARGSSSRFYSLLRSPFSSYMYSCDSEVTYIFR